MAKLEELIAKEAKRINVPAAALRAVFEVESAGKGLVGGKPVIRWEGHYFYRLLNPTKRAIAVKQKLASPSVGGIPNPSSQEGRYKLLARAMEIDEVAALKSISMGLGQIMGENYKLLGYATVQEMFDLSHTLDGQVNAVGRFIVSRKIDRYLRAPQDWEAFARVYNGPKFKMNRYDKKLMNAYIKYAKLKDPQPFTPNPAIASTGDKGDVVRGVQRELNRIGYRVKEDGDYGPATRSQVWRFQATNGLETTGDVDSVTWEKIRATPDTPLAAARSEITEAELKKDSRIASSGDTLTKIGTGTAVVTGAAKAAQESGAIDKIQEVTEKADTLKNAGETAGSVISFFSDNLWILFVILGLAVALIGHHIVKARLEDARSGKTL